MATDIMRFSTLPGMALTANAPGLKRLRQLPEVESISAVHVLAPVAGSLTTTAGHAARRARSPIRRRDLEALLCTARRQGSSSRWVFVCRSLTQTAHQRGSLQKARSGGARSEQPDAGEAAGKVHVRDEAKRTHPFLSYLERERPRAYSADARFGSEEDLATPHRGSVTAASSETSRKSSVRWKAVQQANG
jgi:hypothetical protein